MTTLPQQRPLPQTPQALSEDEKSRISYLLERNWSENTEKTYGKAWRRFTDWAYARGVDPMPVSPQMVAAYLANLVEANLAVATIRTYKAALAAMHRRHGFEDPTDNEEVDRVMAGIAKVLGKPQRQARGLTGDDLAVVKAMARYPRANRAFRGGKETQERTERRARLDVALLSLLRDGLLRISEAANSRWCDIKVEKNGTGCLHILRSKTDQEGNGVLLFLGTKTHDGSAGAPAGRRGSGGLGIRAFRKAALPPYQASYRGSGARRGLQWAQRTRRNGPGPHG